MVNSWLDYIKPFEKIDLFNLLDEVFKENQVQKKVIELNQEQLYSGIDSKDQIIKTIGGNPYRTRTIRIKEAKGQKVDVVTLKDTGEFYDSFKVIITNEGYQIIGEFEKEDGNILDNFSATYDFMGLTEESLTELVYEQVFYFLEKHLRQQAGL